MSNYFEKWPDLCFVRRSDAKSVLASDVLKEVDFLLIYFGPGWHPASRRFTPKLKAFYDAHHAEKKFEVLYISRGSTEDEFRQDFLGQCRNMTETQDAPAASPVVSPDAANDHDKTQGTEDDKLASSHGAHGATVQPQSTIVTNTTTGSSCHGDYYALPVADMEVVAVPLLYHFRVFSYPAVLVFDNRPAGLAEQRARRGTTFAFVPEGFSPVIHPSNAVGGAEGNDDGRNNEARAALPPAGIEYDSKGRRKYTPRIERACHVPKLVSISGYFMVDQGDPSGESFPWAKVSAATAAQRRTFLSIAIAMLAIVCYGMVRYAIPIFVESDRQKKAQRTALAAAMGMTAKH